MKFLFIRPGDLIENKEHLTLGPSTVPPLGLLYLGAVLEQEGHKVEILDYYMENISREKLKNTLISSDAVGITVYTDNLKLSKDTSKMIKDIDPDIPLVIGGPHCSYVQERSLQDIPLADISVIGEGEQAIRDLVDTIPLESIYNICYQNNNELVYTSRQMIYGSLDDFSPAWTDQELHHKYPP